MAIGTPTTIGTNNSTAGTGVTLTTTASVPSGALAILVISWGDTNSRTLSSVSGGSLTWAIDHQLTYNPAGFGYGIAVVSAQAPAGLASSTVISITLSGTVIGSSIAGAYCTGLDTSSAKDVSNGQGQSGVAGWDTTTATTTVADTLLWGGCFKDGGGTQTNAATGGATELHDFQFPAEGWATATEYNILSATASASLTGTWTGSTATGVSAFVAYKGGGPAVANWRPDQGKFPKPVPTDIHKSLPG